MPFEHKLIDLARKPAEFTALYARAAGAGATAKVPLLDLAGEHPIAESLDIARHVAERLGGDALLPAAPEVEGFISLWTERVETAYYDVLRAQSEPEARRARAALLEALALVEDRLFDTHARLGR